MDWRWPLQAQHWSFERGLRPHGLGCSHGRRHGFRRLRASRATDVQTLNQMQDSGAVDHFQVQEMRRQQQRPQVFRIDTSEDEPQAQPQQRIVARPAKRRQPQAQTPFGLNNVPIPVSSDSDRSRISRQSRSDRGPLGTQPSFDQLRNEPELA